MSADPAVKSAAFPAALPRDPEPIRIRTLALLRWIAIAGQLAAVIVAHFMSIGFPVLPVLVLIAAAVAMNLWLSLRPFMRASPSHAIVQLGFDLMQNSALMALTGGMTNPFALLVLAPVTIAATSLNLRQTLALSLAAVALISVAAMVAIPLQDADGGVLRLAPILALGHWAALVIGVAFFAYYAHRVTAELSATSNALFATQMALAREQRLQHLGGVV
ncbi:MAG: ActS/PrrB/RegB family redox-sensitive histidine kinase, partial [Paracoccus sp. (in: a-proteobacteria)]